MKTPYADWTTDGLKAQARDFYRQADKLDLGGARSRADAVKAEAFRQEADAAIAEVMRRKG